MMKSTFVLLPLIFLLSLPVFAQQKEVPLHVSGLKESVEVLRDKWGVNHIYAQNEYDLFFSQGYLAAQDRLFQFEMWRRQATGTLAEIFGEKELKRDISARLFKYRGNLKKEFNHYHENGEEIIHAYVDGINAYIDYTRKHPKTLPIEFETLGITPQKWTADVVVSRHQGIRQNVSQELDIARAVAEVGTQKVKELMWFHPKSPDLTLDTLIDKELLSADILEYYEAYKKPLDFKRLSQSSPFLARSSIEKTDPLTEEESNNWIISGERTESGYPILANDPHRQISLPALRYMVHLNAPGWNVIGAGEPTIPGVSIGHNEHGAWGLTIHATDMEDLYVYELNPKNLSEYKYKGEWRSFDEVQEKISIKDQPEKEVVLRYSVHGPVTYIDSTRHRGFAVKAAWLDAGSAPYLASLRYNQAKNWEEFREASAYNYLPAENMIWADKEGNIGWQVVGLAPIRKHSSGMVPVPGDGRFDWDGYLDIKERPWVLNPSKGFFASANQHNTPPEFLHWNAVGFNWSDDFRADRIHAILSQDIKRNIEQEKQLQADYYSLPAETLVPFLLKIDIESSLGQEAKRYLDGWDYVLGENSIAAGIYNMWERKILENAKKQFVPEEIKDWINLHLTKVISWITAPEDHFGQLASIKRDEFLKTSFEDAVNTLSQKLGSQPENWIYGQKDYKHVAMQNPVHQLLPEKLKNKYTLGPLPRGGNSYTPGVTGNLDNQNHGTTFGIIVDLSDWDKTQMINSPGQSANPESPYYSNLFELWQQNKYFPAYFSKEKILKETDTKTFLLPQ